MNTKGSLSATFGITHFTKKSFSWFPDRRSGFAVTRPGNGGSLRVSRPSDSISWSAEPGSSIKLFPAREQPIETLHLESFVFDGIKNALYPFVLSHF